MNNVMADVRFGNKLKDFYPPTTQTEAKTLFDANDKWDGVESKLEVTPSKQAANALHLVTPDLIGSSCKLLQSSAAFAWLATPTLQLPRYSCRGSKLLWCSARAKRLLG